MKKRRAEYNAPVMGSWYVYLVKCRDGTFYTGITTDIARRLEEHNRGIGARYTRGRRPVKLVYWESLADRSHAATREYALKQLSHAEKASMAGTLRLPRRRT